MNNKVADFWESASGDTVRCLLCPHYCVISSGRSGRCGVRSNLDGTLFASGYGQVTSVALDPIEKKPLYLFHQGKKIVSIGSYGCNFHCPFCQNYGISMEYQRARLEYMTAELVNEVAQLAVCDGNIGVAYTYNEPLIGYEFVKDCSALIRNSGLMNVLVTNGYINKEPLDTLLPMIDALNIDIKGNNDRTYKGVGGTIEVVKDTILSAYNKCHVEVTTLVIPDENEDEVEEIAAWLSSIDPDIPYHLSRFFPRYKYSDRKPTPPETMYKLQDTASKYLNKVFLGNIG